jgi:hypothetical protein
MSAFLVDLHRFPRIGIRKPASMRLTDAFTGSCRGFDGLPAGFSTARTQPQIPPRFSCCKEVELSPRKPK